MTRTTTKTIAAFVFSFAFLFLSVCTIHAQSYNAYSGGYSTGYGTVYGSFGLAMATQNMYNTSQLQMQKAMARQAMINKWGLAAVEKAEREAAAKSSSGSTPPASNPKIIVPPPRVVHNYGKFRPDPAVDTGKALSDALGESPEEKALIKQIYTATKAAYEKAAEPKGWKNNIAGAMTFFTVTAMTVYRDAEEPSDAAVDSYYKIVDASLDELPDFAKVSNKDKQGFHNMLIGFGGLLLAGYTEGKQGNDAATVETYRKLAGGLIQLVLKADPEKLQIENGQIVLK
jgi:hypothetical protein